MKLNLGCGKEIMEDFVNVDINSLDEKVMKVDITKSPLPFKDNQFEYVRLRHVLEHLAIKDQLNLFDELYRITKSEGRIWISVPHESDWCRSIDHYKGYTYLTFRNLDRFWLQKKKRFRVVMETDKPTFFGKIFLHSKIRYYASYIFSKVIKDIIVELEVTK